MFEAHKWQTLFRATREAANYSWSALLNKLYSKVFFKICPHSWDARVVPTTVWQQIFAGVYFCRLAIFCVLRKLIFAIRTDWFFLLGIIFWRLSESTQYPALILFSFLLSRCTRTTYFKTILRCAYPMQNQYFIVNRFVSEQKRQVNWHFDFLVPYFCVANLS